MRMISQSAIDLVKKFEGFYLKAYKCPAGVWTIGYGHTGGVKSGDIITKEQCENLLAEDMEVFCKAVETQIKVPLNDNQFGALVSFSFNVGSGALNKSTLKKKLNAGDYKGAAEEFKRWNKVGNQALLGLTRRRAAERALFLTQSA